MNTREGDNLLNPLPYAESDCVLMAHGGGGRLTQQLIETLFLPAFQNPHLDARHDGAILNNTPNRLAFTTDSYVVQPLFFPGGDIGKLAVMGTANDLAMCGAKPLYLSAGFILEEGLPLNTVAKVVHSMKLAADEIGVTIVTGDTKVIDRNRGTDLMINTSGIGLMREGATIGPAQIQPGDSIVISGDIGRHGIAVLSARENLDFEHTTKSDCQSLSSMVNELFEANIEVHCMRDLTRGGLASALIEISQVSKNQLHLIESEIPICEEVRGACEIMGFDPIYVANEGCMIAIVPKKDAEKTLSIMKGNVAGQQARIIGKVGQPHTIGQVTLKNLMGVDRLVDMISGEQLPRIC